MLLIDELRHLLHLSAKSPSANTSFGHISVQMSNRLAVYSTLLGIVYRAASNGLSTAEISADMSARLSPPAGIWVTVPMTVSHIKEFCQMHGFTYRGSVSRDSKSYHIIDIV